MIKGLRFRQRLSCCRPHEINERRRSKGAEGTGFQRINPPFPPVLSLARCGVLVNGTFVAIANKYGQNIPSCDGVNLRVAAEMKPIILHQTG
jgi:hypothetical protein